MFVGTSKLKLDFMVQELRQQYTHDRYGDENVFSTTIPSLRLLAEKVYSVSIQWFIQEGAKYAGAVRECTTRTPPPPHLSCKIP